MKRCVGEQLKNITFRINVLALKKKIDWEGKQEGKYKPRCVRIVGGVRVAGNGCMGEQNGTFFFSDKTYF